jgi:hypothetical protein
MLDLAAGVFWLEADKNSDKNSLGYTHTALTGLNRYLPGTYLCADFRSLSKEYLYTAPPRPRSFIIRLYPYVSYYSTWPSCGLGCQRAADF